MTSRTGKLHAAPFDAAGWIASHPVFTVEEFAAAHRQGRRRSRLTAHSLLRYHLEHTPELQQVFRGRYATTTDAFVIATSLAPDATIAYTSALEAHGLIEDELDVQWTSATRGTKPFRFAGRAFAPILLPKSLRRRSDRGGGTERLDRGGHPIRVTTLERTFVDLLDRPRQGPPLDFLWSLWLTHGPQLDHQEMVRTALLLGTSLTAMRLGFFLSYHPRFIPQAALVRRLQQLRPAQAMHWDRLASDAGRPAPARRRGETTNSYERDWQLLLPPYLVERRAAAR